MECCPTNHRSMTNLGATLVLFLAFAHDAAAFMVAPRGALRRSVAMRSAAAAPEMVIGVGVIGAGRIGLVHLEVTRMRYDVMRCDAM